MGPRWWMCCGALLGAAGVGLGALGAHLLTGMLEQRVAEHVESAPSDAHGWSEDASSEALRLDRLSKKRLAQYETAVRYHLYHAPMIVLVGLLSAFRRCPVLQLAGWAFLLGILLFSGFLYAWVLLWAVDGSEHPWMVHVVPFGGILLILGWLALAASTVAWKNTASCAAVPRSSNS